MDNEDTRFDANLDDVDAVVALRAPLEVKDDEARRRHEEVQQFPIDGVLVQKHVEGGFWGKEVKTIVSIARPEVVDGLPPRVELFERTLTRRTLTS